MAGGRCNPLLMVLLAAWVAAETEEEARPEQASLPAEQSMVLPMTASNWTLVLEGEWMLKFYAPWCPSCQQTDAEWETFAKIGELLHISVGKVDVIQEPESNIPNEHWEAIEMLLVFLTIEHFTGYFCVQIYIWLLISISVFFHQGCLVTGVLKGKNATEMLRKICVVYGEGAMTDRTCQEWFAKLHTGDFFLDNAHWSGLSGRFFVTTLPAFFHAKDGIFRRYRGPGVYEDLQNYIIQKKWQSVEPLTGWKSPASLTMSGMAGLFTISGKIWHLHNYFTVTLGIPPWCSYVVFIIATLILGLLMGLVLVVISECFCVPVPRHLSEHDEQNEKSKAARRADQLQDVEEEKDDSNEEENKDSLVDDDEEKEDFGDEDEAEEEEEEDNLATGVDEEKSDTRDRGPPREAQEEEPEETEEDAPEQPRSPDTEAAEDTVRQRKSQHAEKGP